MSRQQVIRSTSCFILGRVFGVGGSNGISSDCLNVSGMVFPIHFREIECSFA